MLQLGTAAAASFLKTASNNNGLLTALADSGLNKLRTTLVANPKSALGDAAYLRARAFKHNMNHVSDIPSSKYTDMLYSEKGWPGTYTPTELATANTKIPIMQKIEQNAARLGNQAELSILGNGASPMENFVTKATRRAAIRY